jgi:hypothetical protein
VVTRFSNEISVGWFPKASFPMPAQKAKTRMRREQSATNADMGLGDDRP